MPGTGGIQIIDARGRITTPSAGLHQRNIPIPTRLMALHFAIRNREKQPEWSGWAVKMGLMLAAVALLFGAAGWLLSQYSQAGEPGAPVAL